MEALDSNVGLFTLASMPVLGAIADDFTGAADLSSVLTRGGLRTVQATGVARELRLDDVDALVVALKSRTAPVAEAVRSSCEALAWLQDSGVERILFKICSTFDSTPAGNIGPVADALLDTLGAEIAVVCPAYPVNGRTVYNGHLFVGSTLLSDSSMARHPLTPMTDSDLVSVLGRQTSKRVGLVPQSVVRDGADAIRQAIVALRGQGVSYAVVDANGDHDLRTIGTVCAGMPLSIGAAGLGLGIAAGLGPQRHVAVARDAVSGPAIVLAGSSSEATNEQVRRMAERYLAVEVSVTADEREVDAALERLTHGPVLVYASAAPEDVVRVQREIGAAKAAALVESRLADIATRAVAAGARRVVVAGGETSAAVIQALGIRSLTVGPDIAPGVPWMFSGGEPRLAIALKSGNFGGPDFFLEAVT
jgi:uncharacterized protein YgbK (DUF1537 family)